MTAMTVDEQNAWDYIEEESNELVLEVANRVQGDGFGALMPDERTACEVLAFKILSQAMIKQLAIMTEKINHPNLAMAYMQMAPMHASIIQTMLVKDMKQRL